MEISSKPVWVCPNCSMDFHSTQQLSLHMERFCPSGSQVLKIDPLHQKGKLDSNQLSDLYGLPQSLVEKVKLLVSTYIDSVPAKVMKRLIRNHSQFPGELNKDRWLEIMSALENLYGSDIPVSAILRAFSQGGYEGFQVGMYREIDDLEAGHRKTLAQIYGDRLDLARQKQRLEHRLSNVDTHQHQKHTVLHSPDPDIKDGSSDLLKKLQAQGAKNQEMLGKLRNQLDALVNSKSVEHLDEGRQQKVSTGSNEHYVPSPFWFSESLVDDVIRLRESYVQDGGEDKRVLNQLADLQVEAMLIENARIGELGAGEAVRRPKITSRRQPIEERLLALERENRRLQDELEATGSDKSENGKDTANVKSDVEGLKDSLARLIGLQEEMLSAKQEVDLARLSQDIDQLKNQKKEEPAQASPNSMFSFSEVPPQREPGPVSVTIFYDFVKGLDFSMKAIRLVVSLFDGHNQCGPPSIFPEAITEHSSPIDRYLSAMVGVRQPILKVSTSSEMSVIMEIQGTDGLSGNFSTIGWTKYRMFDRHGFLLDGMWKQSVKILPIYPAVTGADLSGIPDAGLAAIYLRIVSQQNLGSQSTVSVSLAQHMMYSTLPYRE